jgi:hypothetical protein
MSDQPPVLLTEPDVRRNRANGPEIALWVIGDINARRRALTLQPLATMLPARIPTSPADVGTADYAPFMRPSDGSTDSPQ